MKKNIVLLALLAFSKTFGQVDNIIPLPTTPDAYSLSKVSDLEMDYFRGQANISIPFHIINIDDVSIPINLSYNTSGIKLNEIASSVGLGWSLNIPGYINQDIKGLNDLKDQLYSKDIRDYDQLNGFIIGTIANDEFRVKIGEIEKGQYDTQPDLFSYNMPTSSGSFIKDENKGIPIPYNNDSINFTSNKSISITDSYGNKYLLSGKNFATNISTPIEVNSTLFKIDEITTQNNKKVKFYYDKFFGYGDTSIYEKAHLRQIQPSNNSQQLLIPYEREEKENFNSEQLVSKIETDNEVVFFKYSDESTDLFINNKPYRNDTNGQSIALRKIIVKNKQSKIIKEYTLNYSYFSNDNNPKTPNDYRLKLINIYNNLDNTYYSFEYNEEFKLPRRNSFNDDHWGYVNSLNNIGNSNIPSSINYGIDYIQEDFDRINDKRDRNPNFTYTKIGSLTKIVYPTKGYKIFEYDRPIGEEIKMFSGVYGNKTFKSYTLKALENDSSISGVFNFTDDDVFNISKEEKNASPYLEYTFSNTCKNNNTEPNTIQETMCSGNLNNIYFDGPPSEGNIFENITSLYSANLNKINNFTDPCRCSITLNLNYKYPIYLNTIPSYPSLRIKSISDYDHNSNLVNKKEYKYGKYENNIFKPYAYLDKPITYLNTSHIFVPQNGSTTPKYEVSDILTIHNSNQSTTSYGSSKGVFYPYVIEYTDGGSIEYEFKSPNRYNLSTMFSLINRDYDDWKTGLIENKKIKSENSTLLEEFIYEYNFNDIRNSSSNFYTNMTSPKPATSFGVHLNIISRDLMYTPFPSGHDKEFYIDRKMYWINSSSIENVKITNKKYFDNFKFIENITFNNYSNDLQKPFYIKSSNTTNSKGETLTTEYQYPPDLTSGYEQSSLMEEMIRRNMIANPVITTSKNGSIVLSEQRTLYKFFPGTNGTLILPEFVYVKKGATTTAADRKITYNSYDKQGNLTQYTLENGLPVSIIWGYNNQYPVAKLEGVALSQINGATITTLNTKTTDADLLTALTSLRTAHKDAMVTGYLYKPLIGVTQIIQPNGVSEKYNYDSSNRLQSIVNDKNEVLKTFQYNYKP